MRRSKIIVSLTLLATLVSRAALGQSTGPTTQPATQPATIAPDAQAMLDQIRDAYAKVSTLELAGAYSMDMDVAGEPRKSSTTFTAWFEAPNKFRHEMKDDDIVVSTGEKMFSVLVSRNQYISID